VDGSAERVQSRNFGAGVESNAEPIAEMQALTPSLNPIVTETGHNEQKYACQNWHKLESESDSQALYPLNRCHQFCHPTKIFGGIWHYVAQASKFMDTRMDTRVYHS